MRMPVSAGSRAEHVADERVVLAAAVEEPVAAHRGLMRLATGFNETGGERPRCGTEGCRPRAAVRGRGTGLRGDGKYRRECRQPMRG
jgi:hypothetical protein